MKILSTVGHYTNLFLLTFLGPADLDDANDPRVALKRKHAARNQPDPVVATAGPAVAAGVAPEAVAAPAGMRAIG